MTEPSKLDGSDDTQPLYSVNGSLDDTLATMRYCLVNNSSTNLCDGCIQHEKQAKQAIKALMIEIVGKTREIYLTNEMIANGDDGSSTAEHWDTLRKLIIKDLENL